MTSFSKKEWALLASSIIVSGVILFGVYFLFLKPMNDQVEIRTKELSAEGKLIKVVKQKVSEIKQNTFESTVSLQMKVPVKSATENLLLDLEKAEVVSQSTIQSLEFADGDISQTLQADTSKLSHDDQVKDSSDSSPKTPLATPNSNSQTNKEVVLPNGLQKITIKIDLDTESYTDFKKFLSELEGLKRIVEVEQISFQGPPEVKTVEDAPGLMEYSLVVSAFYLPGIDDLTKQLPGIDSPLPANKNNPFALSPDVSEDAAPN
ncbi:hypothetical protein [Falsibacillus albus]|uniref:Pilus assembly protein PilO n=1 Tax=Falsibacillus albus TaxID=2478915 RepID=A0A3L7K726_9BACI|nr:hypothetical protein [Falsibacillus albus]RLQ98054.1 hypothetical protein D9X91_01305 [Falsibacillus albus]